LPGTGVDEASFGHVVQIVGAQAIMLTCRDMFYLIGAVFVLSLLPALFIAGQRVSNPPPAVRPEHTQATRSS
jgi:hypothetical protein